MNPHEDALAALYAAPGAAGHPEATPAPFSAAAVVLGLVARLQEDPHADPEALRVEWLGNVGPLDAEMTVIVACALLARTLREDPAAVLADIRLRVAGGGPR